MVGLDAFSSCSSASPDTALNIPPCNHCHNIMRPGQVDPTHRTVTHSLKSLSEARPASIGHGPTCTRPLDMVSALITCRLHDRLECSLRSAIAWAESASWLWGTACHSSAVLSYRHALGSAQSLANCTCSQHQCGACLLYWKPAEMRAGHGR